MTGRRKFNQAIGSFSQSKVDKPLYFSGLLGLLTGGEFIVEVPNRPGYVWVRLRNSANEIIQAHNQSISPVYDLPVLVERDPHSPNRYRIVGRDIGRYGDWGSTSPYSPSHGNQHSFPPDVTSGGGDILWVYGRQFMPLLAYPSGSAGSLNAVVYNYPYYYNNDWKYAGGTGTPNLSGLKPTDGQARMVLLCMDTDTGNFYIVTGSTFSAAITGTAGIMPYLPDMVDNNDVPIAGIRLLSGTSSLTWANLYDVRPYYTNQSQSGNAPTSAQYVTMALDATLGQERVLTAGNAVTITDAGANSTVTVGVSTGTFSLASHTHSIGSVVGSGLLIYDSGVFKVTGTAIDFADNLTVVVTGSIAYVHGQSGSGGTRTFTFAVPGTLTVGSIAVRLHAPQAGTISNVTATVGTAPTGASIIVDVNKNGTTIFTTQGNRPTITAGNQDDLSSTPDVTSFVLNDVFTMDLDQVGSTIAGSDLIVQVRWT